MRSLFIIAMLCALLLLGGCTSTDFKQLETGAVAGTFNGQPVRIEWKRDTSGQMIVDLHVPTAVSAAASIATGGWSDLLLPIGEAALIALTGGAAISERSKRVRADQAADHHRADAAEGWAEWKASEERARELALQVPPA